MLNSCQVCVRKRREMPSRTQPEPVFQLLISLHGPEFKPAKKMRRAAHPHLGCMSPQGLSRKARGLGAVEMCHDLSIA